MSEEKATGLARLREPFEPRQINKLPKPYKADSPKGNCRECDGYHGLPAVHLDYVGHAALTDRLLEVDPAWTWEPLAIGPDGLPVYDKDGGLWIRLTICGITRLGYGDAQGKRGGNAVKEAIGDALRNAGMRFGAALDLWHKGDLHEAAQERGTAPEPEAATEAKPARTVQRAKPSSAETIATWTAAIEERAGDIDALRKLYTDAAAQKVGPDVLNLIQTAATNNAA